MPHCIRKMLAWHNSIYLRAQDAVFVAPASIAQPGIDVFTQAVSFTGSAASPPTADDESGSSAR